MSNIRATYSQVESFSSNCSDEYNAILDVANDILSRVQDMYNRVQEELEKINEKIMRAQRLRDDTQVIVDKYQALMDEAAAKIAQCDAEISYVLSHPITRSYTDKDGYTHTYEEVDQAALSAAQRARDAAQAEYDAYKAKFDQANAVLQEIVAVINKYDKIRQGIQQIAQVIQQDLLEIQKFIEAISNEAEYNMQHLQGVVDSLGAYLASKAIYVPAGSQIQDFSASSSSNSTVKNAGTSSSHSEEQLNANRTSKNSKAMEIRGNVDYAPIETPKAVSERYFKKQSKRDARGLSDKEKEQLKVYLDNNDFNPAYVQINNHLRFGGEISKNLSQTIDTITDSLSKHTIKRDMILYRGIHRKGAEDIFGQMDGKTISELNSTLCGKVFWEKGFSSTSISKNAKLINEYCGYKGVVFNIRVPSGAEGIFTNQVANYDEREVLLQKDMVYRIDGVKANRDYYEMDVSLIGRKK